LSSNSPRTAIATVVIAVVVGKGLVDTFFGRLPEKERSQVEQVDTANQGFAPTASVNKKRDRSVSETNSDN
jgi:hypothetical protein